MHCVCLQFSSVAQSCPTLCDPWTAACHASLFITNSQILLKLMSIESMMPSNHLILCCPFSSCLQSSPASRSFPMSQLFTSGQFSSVAQSWPSLGDPMDGSTPGLPVHCQLPEFTQIHVHCVGDGIQPSCPWSSPSPPTFNLSQHQGLFK